MIRRRLNAILLVRNQRQIARLVPEPPAKDALSVLGDLHRTLDNSTADDLAARVALAKRGKRGKLTELRNPWDS